jgi:predicted RecA/RadA family phage recombinase
MSIKYVQPGERINYSNSGSAITSGSVVVLGDRIGVAEVDIAATTGTGSVQLEGVFTLDKTTSQAWAQGDKLFWVTSTSKLSTTATGNIPAGYCFEAAGSSDTTGKIKLFPQPKQMPVQAASVAADAAGAVVDLNLLIAKLKAAGFMANS